MNHSEHYPTFIEHPEDPARRVIVQTPWLHHKQLKAWGLQGLDPEPAPPAGEAQRAQPHDPEFPKWIENPNTHQRALVPSAQAEAAQLTAWGLGPDADPELNNGEHENDELKKDGTGTGSESKEAGDQCDAWRKGKQCLLTEGHEGNHQYKGVEENGAGN